MAPARRKAAAGARGRKLSAFLKDFDREVRSRVEQLRTNGERLVKEMENLYDVELLRLPAALREMNWLEFFGTGGGRGRGRGGLPLKRRSEAVAEERWDAARGARASRTRVGAGGCAAPSARGRSLAAGTPAVRCPLLRRRYGAPACVAGAVPATCRSDASKGNIFFVAKGGSQKVVEEAVTADLGITEINKLTAELIQTPLKIVTKEKSKQGIEATEEAAEVPLLPPAKKAKHDSQLLLEQAAASTNPRNGK